MLRKCANKDCKNQWEEEEPTEILMCGGHAKVCENCKIDGYSVYDGIGDGMFHLYKSDTKIAVYDLKMAYNIKHTCNDIHEKILKDLSDELLPNLAHVSDSELQEYSKYLQDFGFIQKDEEDNWSSRELVDMFNNYFEEIGAETIFSFIRSSNKLVKNFDKVNHVYFTMFVDYEPFIVWFDMENIKFGFL